MRLLHTSDWHLGRTLHRADLRDAQAAFVAALVACVRSERVDVVVVAGDVYDRAVPPVDAVELFEHALRELRGAGAVVVVSSGNHDSAIRLGANASLIAAGGVHLRTRPQALAVPVVVEDAHGPVGVYAVPYLEPSAVGTALPLPGAAGPVDAADPVGGGVPRGHAGVLGRAAGLVAADARARGLRRTVVAAHAWVTGAAASDSERDIGVGGLGHVPAAVFAPFSYAALGHLHGPQQVSPSVRYSGSPLPYSFGEAAHRKGWWLVELDAGGLGRVEKVPAPVHRRLSAVRGPLDQLLAAPDHTELEPDFLAVTLTDPTRPADAMDRLRRRFPHVLTLAWEPAGGGDTGGSYARRVTHRTDLQVVAEFLEHARGTGPSGAEHALFGQAFEAVRVEAAADAGAGR